MNPTQLMLGAFPFSLATTEYQQLKRTLAWRWPSHPRLNRPPALQYQGPEAITLALNGTIHVTDAEDLTLPEAMQREADRGEPLPLIVGNGRYQASYGGLWVITELAFQERDLLGDGTPLTIAFSITLKQWGEDEI